MARTWLSIRVDLIEGHGEHLWPRPGRIFAAAQTHTFAQLADAIDDGFARWDRAHLHQFEFADGTRLTTRYEDWEELGPALDDRRTRLGRLKPGEQFVYEFDFGNSWNHLCTVGPERIDPEEALGIVPGTPLPYWGWGVIPDAYLRRWDGDDGEHRHPRDPGVSDLPPLRPRGVCGRELSDSDPRTAGAGLRSRQHPGGQHWRGRVHGLSAPPRGPLPYRHRERQGEGRAIDADASDARGRAKQILGREAISRGCWTWC